MQDSLEKQKLYYNNRWSQLTYLNKLQIQRLNEILQAIQKINLANPKILDFGCGDGWLTSILNHIGPTLGIDLSDKAVNLAKKMYPTAEFFYGNVFQYPFEKESFNIVISQEVIEHVLNQELYLELAARYLKRGGFLILTTPNSFNFNRWDKKALQSWGMQPIENWLNPKQLKKLLLTKGFRIIEMKTIIPDYGTKGIFKIINSVKINELFKLLKIKLIFDHITLKAGYGLHIFVLAKKK
jgi:2-polyprenyl-3-methyl-5-hydroxy-6-metoxy-1,4-benzoquinol methylase